MAAHQKHTQLAKPHNGVFVRREWAILGTPCAQIEVLARALALALGTDYRVGYADADHKQGDEDEKNPFSLTYTDKIDFHRFDMVIRQGAAVPLRDFFKDADLVLVNGNHFSANRQLVVLDPRKMDSLARKTDRLTQVDAFLCLDETPIAVPLFLQKILLNWESIPVFRLSETDKIAGLLRQHLLPVPLRALVLVGGRSVRMGSDKSLLPWHGKPQRDHLAEILQTMGLAVSFSCRAEQAGAFIEQQQVIADTFLDLGPFGAILSAFREDPGAAWMVLASDLPLLDRDTLDFLRLHRDPSALATAFRSPHSPEGFPEPLITIWEPRAYPTMLQFLAQGVSCPRKVLLQRSTALLDAPNPAALTNVNTPEERSKMDNLLQSVRP